MTDNNTSPWRLFLVFAKIGAMTFGGGYAMLPIIERELIVKRNWISPEELMDFYAISQATPGVIAVNVATLIGYKKSRYAGSVMATLGVVTPSVIIITIITAFLSLWTEEEIVKRVFSALRVCVAALVLNAVIPFYRRGITDLFGFILFILSFAAFLFLKISPAIIVIVCAGAYTAYDSYKRRSK
jgi:chromate transporter